MATVVDSETVPVLIVSASELGSRSGSILSALGSGALVRVDQVQQRRAACLMVPPQLIPRALEALGIDSEQLSAPGTANDRV